MWMPPPGDARAAKAGAALLAVATAVFVVMQLSIGLHPDDRAIIDDVVHGGYGEIWTSTFLGRFYRPVVVTLVKLCLDLCGEVVLPLRLLNGLLIAAMVLLLVRLFAATAGRFARLAAGLCLLASPMTFVSITQFAVGTGDLIAGLMFLLCVELCHRDPELRRPAAPLRLVGFALVALLSKESGLLVAAYASFEGLRRRRWWTAAALATLMLGYLALRGAVIEQRLFSFPTGFLGRMYSIEELQRSFGASPRGLYLYNVAASLLSVVVYVPVHGQFRFAANLLLLAPTFALTAFAVARFLVVTRTWRTHLPLLGVIAMNAALGYMYVRPRIMFVAYLAIAILWLLALDDLWRRPQRLLGIAGRGFAVGVVALWLAVLANTLARLALQAGPAAT
jgi:hypothetical protein